MSAIELALKRIESMAQFCKDEADKRPNDRRYWWDRGAGLDEAAQIIREEIEREKSNA